MRPEETLSLTVTLPNDHRIEMPETVVRWSSGPEFAVENLAAEAHPMSLPYTFRQATDAGDTPLA